MFKYLFIPAITLLILGCNTMSTHKSLADSIHAVDTPLKTIEPARMIVPGKRIGNIYINENVDSVVAKLGKPDWRDAAMGASFMAWFDKKGKNVHQTSIYADRNMGAANKKANYVKEIRETSPSFKTADYGGAGSEIKDVIKLYKLKKHRAPGNKKFWLYDNYQAGIGFEVDSTGKCLAVYIHAPNDSSATYLNVH
ncbi:hypothetical protein [Mucilaginibacter sp. L196]|uniref:hypothetical protein n=1 Tax=Mucilaginibacter sp. L196 TaxID=1641870 RepID=UPI00131AEAE2|nr:hypothetical protein [Mucilaginibacter sp. L196]